MGGQEGPHAGGHCRREVGEGQPSLPGTAHAKALRLEKGIRDSGKVGVGGASSQPGGGDVAREGPGGWQPWEVGGGALVWEQLPLAVMGAGQGTWKAVGRQWQACWGQGLGWGRGGWGGHWVAPSCLGVESAGLGTDPMGEALGGGGWELGLSSQ